MPPSAPSCGPSWRWCVSSSSGRERRSTTCRSAWCWSTPTGAVVMRNARRASSAAAHGDVLVQEAVERARAAGARGRELGARRSSCSARRGRCSHVHGDAAARRRSGRRDRRHQRARPPRRGAHRLRRQHQPRAEDAGRCARRAGRDDGRRGRPRRSSTGLSGKMVDEAHRAATAIDDLLELSRIELGGAAVRDPVDVGTLIARRRGAHAGRGRAARHPHRSSTNRPTSSSCLGDRRQLVSALGNLIDNAVKYSEPGSEVVGRRRAVDDGGRRDRRRRHRHRHPRPRPRPDLRAVLPRRPGAQPGHRRHRSRPGDRPPRGDQPRRRGRWCNRQKARARTFTLRIPVAP